MVLYGIRCVNLHEDTIKILVIHYSCNKKLEYDKNFKNYIAKTENALKSWRSMKL